MEDLSGIVSSAPDDLSSRSAAAKESRRDHFEAGVVTAIASAAGVSLASTPSIAELTTAGSHPAEHRN